MTATPDRSSGATQAAIEHHYDVGADFYRLWLDARMVYSCALWAGPIDDDLETAQEAKLDWHLATAGAAAGGRLLDVGCGWGALLQRARSHVGVADAVGLTLSRDQMDVASAAGDDAHIEVRLEDWRRHQPSAPYDAIVSVGAFEHFARLDLDDEARTAVYRQWFEATAGWLVPGGRISLQSIAYEDFDRAHGTEAAFFAEQVFPESSLPRLSQIVVAAEPWFRVLVVRSDADQYAQTLRLWQRRLESAAVVAQSMVGRDTYRRYVRYLRLSRAMFERRVCTLYRIGFERRA
ncbi:MAG TPA: cyclopropane-fatty-acyl-phospholipid synthase family protein [Acidimicrobiales bacterium]|nr:cyclopropane-fatty-acyl-phospholipid synthase family protein [Acidimicrobiales bacterium]